eukprot:TRINITY_DN4738_c0_g1_i3.p1 TRINITY_DN4738_c0_g1~~TRINITY_DN4738_c0_g1_i3.p1  ORF type:complete len:511 (+),score=54.61 TRINITY_DN4738_c0_g1_i3:105-1637(+)
MKFFVCIVLLAAVVHYVAACTYIQTVNISPIVRFPSQFLVKVDATVYILQDLSTAFRAECNVGGRKYEATSWNVTKNSFTGTCLLNFSSEHFGWSTTNTIILYLPEVCIEFNGGPLYLLGNDTCGDGYLGSYPMCQRCHPQQMTCYGGDRYVVQDGSLCNVSPLAGATNLVYCQRCAQCVNNTCSKPHFDIGFACTSCTYGYKLLFDQCVHNLGEAIGAATLLPVGGVIWLALILALWFAPATALMEFQFITRMARFLYMGTMTFAPVMFPQSDYFGLLMSAYLPHWAALPLFIEWYLAGNVSYGTELNWVTHYVLAWLVPVALVTVCGIGFAVMAKVRPCPPDAPDTQTEHDSMIKDSRLVPSSDHGPQFKTYSERFGFAVATLYFFFIDNAVFTCILFINGDPTTRQIYGGVQTAMIAVLCALVVFLLLVPTIVLLVVQRKVQAGMKPRPFVQGLVDGTRGLARPERWWYPMTVFILVRPQTEVIRVMIHVVLPDGFLCSYRSHCFVI